MSQVEFTGVVIPAGKEVQVAAEFDEDQYETYHFTQAALGAKAKPGPHTLFVGKGDRKYAIGTLDAARCLQFPCDITLAMDEVVLSHSGASEVHLTGYRVEQLMVEAGSDDEYSRFGSEEESEGEEQDQESEDDGEVPRAVPIKGLAGRLGKAPAQQLLDDEAEEGSSEDEDKEMGVEGDEDSEEEDEQQATRRIPTNGRLIAGYEDSSEEEELSSGEEEEEEDSKKEPAPAPKQQQQLPQKQQGTKRPAAQQLAAAIATTPQHAKKAKAEQLKAPATAPAKVAVAKLAAAQAQAPAKPPPSNEKEYLAALKVVLQAAGPMKLATLGTKVKRPPQLPKFKQFIDKHPAVFKFDKEADTVSLA